MTYDVFISHSHDDKIIADAICARLEEHGIRCWVAPRDILPGVEWDEAIEEALGIVKAMVLVFSARANDSPHVKREVVLAFGNGVTVIPLRMEAVEPSKGFGYYLRGIHWLDARTPPLEQHLGELSDRLRGLMGLPGAELQTPETSVAPATPIPDLRHFPRPNRTKPRIKPQPDTAKESETIVALDAAPTAQDTSGEAVMTAEPVDADTLAQSSGVDDLCAGVAEANTPESRAVASATLSMPKPQREASDIAKPVDAEVPNIPSDSNQADTPPHPVEISDRAVVAGPPQVLANLPSRELSDTRDTIPDRGDDISFQPVDTAVERDAVVTPATVPETQISGDSTPDSVEAEHNVPATADQYDADNGITQEPDPDVTEEDDPVIAVLPVAQRILETEKPVVPEFAAQSEPLPAKEATTKAAVPNAAVIGTVTPQPKYGSETDTTTIRGTSVPSVPTADSTVMRALSNAFRIACACSAALGSIVVFSYALVGPRQIANAGGAFAWLILPPIVGGIATVWLLQLLRKAASSANSKSAFMNITFIYAGLAVVGVTTLWPLVVFVAVFIFRLLFPKQRDPSA